MKRHRSRLKSFGSGCWKCTTCCLHNIRKFIKALVEHKWFQQGILLAILFNTLSMGIEYHNQVCIRCKSCQSFWLKSDNFYCF